MLTNLQHKVALDEIARFQREGKLLVKVRMRFGTMHSRLLCSLLLIRLQVHLYVGIAESGISSRS